VQETTIIKTYFIALCTDVAIYTRVQYLWTKCYLLQNDDCLQNFHFITIW